MTHSDFATFQSVLNPVQNNDIFVRFYDKSIKTTKLNTKTGLPVFKNVCFVEIRIKNNNTDIYDQPASIEKKSLYPIEYNRYLLAKKEQEKGTPLNQFSFLTASQLDTLKQSNITSIESLMALSKTQVQDLDIEYEFNKAKSFLEMAQNTQTYEELMQENKALKEQLALKSKKGRPKKATV